MAEEYRGQLRKEDIERVRKFGIKNVRITREAILNASTLTPERAFNRVTLGSGKPALYVDLMAEQKFEQAFRERGETRLIRNVEVYGEESLAREDAAEIDLTDKPGIFALVDMVDGTDLLERGLYNWCSAVVFFQPRREAGHRILCSVVGLPTGEIYYASDDEDGAWVIWEGRHAPERVGGPSKVASLGDVSLCFYGQKPENFLMAAKQPLFEALRSEEAVRIYTLAGIPMMVKLVDHRVETARNIDAVIEFVGQKPHDAVPGAYIALKAGAIMKNPFTLDSTGQPIRITYEELEAGLMHPANDTYDLTYVLAATEELCDEICRNLVKPE